MPSSDGQLSSQTVLAEETEEEWTDFEDDASLGYLSDEVSQGVSSDLGETSTGERSTEHKQVFIVDPSTGYIMAFPGRSSKCPSLWKSLTALTLCPS